MSKETVVRQFARGDEEAVVHLLESVFKGWPHFDLSCSAIDHWRWKFFDNPLRMSSIVVSLVEGEIVGCSHGLYSKVMVGGKSQISQQGVDVAVSKDFRGRGIMGQMIALKEEHHKKLNVNLSYTLSSNSSVVKRDLKQGHPQFPKPLRRYVKIRDIDLHLRMTNSEGELVKKYGYKTLKASKQVLNLLNQSRGESRSHLEVEQTDRFGDEIEDFWRQTEPGYDFIVERDKTYLNWRYCDPRGGDYLVSQAKEDGEVLGYIVLRVNRFNKEYPQGYIVDLLALPNRLDVGNALVEVTNDYFAEQGINIVDTLAIRGHPYEWIFEKNGFLWDRQKYYLFCTPRNIGGEWEKFIDAPSSRLHFTYGDVDWI